ncbi:ABC transporter ATP-binding protein [Halomonas binhaiensis]|uniref:ABC transporter ATP-binding protein n=1 Tax=Halomonas binhaiensis TaxID=2562282 RepID=A0A5C1NB00_9GAMM|nr:ABC transporter ATP-binding protein [Halomonas binhaiensis]QEM80324.1 ABC transporter ATP-binding protein [Halomonas binhaiensis]
MIEISHLYKRYHNHHGSDWVLRDIDLIIPEGISVGLVGRNGAGKSTLLRLIAGMDNPERGQITRHARVSWPIGLSGGFQGSMTGRQNVKFVARVHGERQDVQSIIDKVEAFAELGPAFDEPIRTYSSGMRARLNFGLSLAFDFDVYLSDEATAVGDRSFRAKATKAFKDKVGQASLIMVSHSEDILKELCQSGIYLKDGQAEWFDDIGDAINAYHVDTDPPQDEEKKAEPPEDLSSLTLQQLHALRKERRAAFDKAKQEMEAAQTPSTPPDERKAYGSAFREAREKWHAVIVAIQNRQQKETTE